MTENLAIKFGIKFCQRQLKDFIGQNDGQDNKSFWDQSLLPEVNQVIFDLSITEWIATEEVTFLFAWIRKLLSLSKKVRVDLPYGAPIQRIYGREQLDFFYKKYQFKDNEQRIKKRYNRNVFLMVNWGLLNNTGLQQANFNHLLELSVYNHRYDLLADDNFNKVVPFSIVDASFDGKLVKFDAVFSEVLRGSRSKNSTLALFEVEKKVRDILTSHGCYSAFESKTLSNVIFQELFLNTCQHSFDSHTPKSNRECYMAMSFSGKKQIQDHSRYVENLLDEIDVECFDFYKDKKAILKEMQKELKTYEKFEKLEKRAAKLDNYRLVGNESYLEYTFLDFGVGYSQTLETLYTENKEKYLAHLSLSHENANKDAQIIEYAYLLETSSIPISENIENYNLIPRGLYFLIDIIRRFKGLLKIRSGQGLVTYDFSDKIYLEVIDRRPQLFLHSPYTVKECVTHTRNEIGLFQGNMVSIILPPKVFQRFKKESTKSISPIRIDNSILNKYVYYKSEFQFDDLDPRSYEYLSLLFLMNKVIEAYNLQEAKNQDNDSRLTSKDLNRFFYNQLYSELIAALANYAEKNCVIFIDFAQLPLDSQILKLIYYLLDTPRINELTKAVFVNLDTDRTELLMLLKEKIQRDQSEPLLYKAIPCFSFGDITQLNAVKWIGLRDERDEDILTKVLFGEQISTEKLHSIKNAEGNILYEYEGWVYSFLKATTEEQTV